MATELHATAVKPITKLAVAKKNYDVINFDDISYILPAIDQSNSHLMAPLVAFCKKEDIEMTMLIQGVSISPFIPPSNAKVTEHPKFKIDSFVRVNNKQIIARMSSELLAILGTEAVEMMATNIETQSSGESKTKIIKDANGKLIAVQEDPNIEMAIVWDNTEFIATKDAKGYTEEQYGGSAKGRLVNGMFECRYGLLKVK